MLVWPAALLTQETDRWRLAGVTIAGGVNVGGLSRLARTDGGGLWTCAMTGIEVYGPERLHAAELLELQLEAGVTPIIVPRYNQHLAPIPTGAALTALDTDIDDSLFEDPDYYTGLAIQAGVTANAALRATTLQVEFEVAAALMGAEPFSIMHPVRGRRLYGVHSVGATVDDVTTITIRPPLREAVLADTRLDFDNPGCVMRLVNPDWLSPLDPTHEMTAAPTWVEHF